MAKLCLIINRFPQVCEERSERFFRVAVKLKWRSDMKKLSIVLILLLAIGVAGGCGKKAAPKTDVAKTPSTGQKASPHATTFPPASAQDKADLEAALKKFWATLNDGKFSELTAQIYKAPADAVKGLEDNIKKNEVGSFEFVKLTNVTANNGLAAVGYVVLEKMGKGMTAKYPDIGVLALIKDGQVWKVVLDKKAIAEKDVTVLTNMVMQQQQELQKDPEYGKYQKMQQAFIVEAQATKQKFIQAPPATKAPAAGQGQALPPNHPSK